jgi:hypothetical protein
MNVVQRSNQQRADRGDQSRRQSRKGVQQDAPHQHAAAAQAVGKISAQQAEDAARHRGDVEQQAHPVIEVRRARLHLGDLHQGRPHDQRQDQQGVGIEREADGGHGADDPLHWGEAVSGSGWRLGHVLGVL